MPQLIDDIGLYKPQSLEDDAGIFDGKIKLEDDAKIFDVDTSDLEPLPEADVSPYAIKEAGKQVLATGELAGSLVSTAALYPASKAYGLMALPFGADVAKQAEQDIMQWVYQPKIESAKGAMNLIGTGFEAYLTPSRMAQEEIEKFSPRLGYLVGTIGEVSQLAVLPKVGKTAKAKYVKFKNNAIVKKARNNGARVMDLVGDRRASIDKGILDSEIFIRDIERNFTPQELEAVPFLRQKIKDPEVLKTIGREDLIPIIEKPPPKLKAEVKKIGEYYDDAYKFLSENWDDVGFVEDYVTHIWDIPKERKGEVVNYFATKNPFMKKKTIPTLEEGIKLGLKPKTTNITDLLRVYDQYKVKTVHNMKFAENLKRVVDENGNPLVMRQDKAPNDWVIVDHPALNRAMGRKVGKDAVLIERLPVKVNPEIASELSIIFDKPFSHEAISAYEIVNAFTKKSMLSLSFFHHVALTESAFSTGIGIKAMKMWNPFEVYKQVKSKNFDIYRKQELAKDAIDHGVTFGALEDVHRGTVENALRWIEKETKDDFAIGTGAKVLRKANQLWDTTLWDYYHNNLKLYAYEANISKALKSARSRYGRALTPEEIKTTKFEMGKFVNDSFGGQNWELSKVMGNPKMRQMAHWIFLAPDWTLSTIKQATAPVRGLVKGAQGKPGGAALAKQGGMFWARAALYFNIVVQSANYYNTKKEYGEGRFSWQNAPGHELNIFSGRNKDGTERYLRMGKQFREVMEWGLDPIRKFGAKLSPLLRESIRQVGGHDPGSGYPTEWADEDDFWKTIMPRVKSIAEMPIPFSLRPYIKDRPTMFMFALPASKGMTNYKSIKLFKNALQEKSGSKIRRIYFAALENNLDAKSLYNIAKMSIKSDITYNDKDMAKDILMELESLSGEARQDAYGIYERRGILTDGIKKELNKLLKKKASIKQQKEMFNIKGK